MSTGYGRGDASFDFRSEEPARERSHDTSRETHSKRGDNSFHSSAATSSRATSGRNESYDPYYPEKVEYSCDEAGACQKLSFLFLVIAFLGTGIAVCTPYWVVAYDGDQMSLYEGIWLSCARQGREMGSWFCSNFGTVRKLSSQPGWYSTAQVCAFLSLILLVPAMVAGTLYSYVVALPGRSRASWLMLIFLIICAALNFLSFVVYAAGYPMDQRFPSGTGRPRMHISFALQIISWAVLMLSIGTHLRDVWGTMKIWDNNKNDATSAYVTGAGSRESPVHKSTAQPARSSPGPKIPSFSLPTLPAALNRFRFSKKDNSPSAPPPPQSSAMAREEFSEEPRGAIGGRNAPSAVQSSGPYVSGGASSASAPRGRVTSYESYAPPVNESFKSHDSQV